MVRLGSAGDVRQPKDEERVVRGFRDAISDREERAYPTDDVCFLFYLPLHRLHDRLVSLDISGRDRPLSLRRAVGLPDDEEPSLRTRNAPTPTVMGRVATFGNMPPEKTWNGMAFCPHRPSPKDGVSWVARSRSRPSGS